MYCHLFWRYLEAKYNSTDEANEKYNTFFNLIDNEFPKIRENLRLIMLEVGIDNLAEIIVEALNLKDLLNEEN